MAKAMVGFFKSKHGKAGEFDLHNCQPLNFKDMNNHQQKTFLDTLRDETKITLGTDDNYQRDNSGFSKYLKSFQKPLLSLPECFSDAHCTIGLQEDPENPLELPNCNSKVCSTPVVVEMEVDVRGTSEAESDALMRTALSKVMFGSAKQADQEHVNIIRMPLPSGGATSMKSTSGASSVDDVAATASSMFEMEGESEVASDSGSSVWSIIQGDEFEERTSASEDEEENEVEEDTDNGAGEDESRDTEEDSDAEVENRGFENSDDEETRATDRQSGGYRHHRQKAKARGRKDRDDDAGHDERATARHHSRAPHGKAHAYQHRARALEEDDEQEGDVDDEHRGSPPSFLQFRQEMVEWIEDSDTCEPPDCIKEKIKVVVRGDQVSNVKSRHALLALQGETKKASLSGSSLKERSLGKTFQVGINKVFSTCGARVLPLHATKVCGQSESGSPCELECEEGFLAHNTIICGMEGLWSDQDQKSSASNHFFDCKEVTCRTKAFPKTCPRDVEGCFRWKDSACARGGFSASQAICEVEPAEGYYLEDPASNKWHCKVSGQWELPRDLQQEPRMLEAECDAKDAESLIDTDTVERICKKAYTGRLEKTSKETGYCQVWCKDGMAPSSTTRLSCKLDENGKARWHGRAKCEQGASCKTQDLENDLHENDCKHDIMQEGASCNVRCRKGGAQESTMSCGQDGKWHGKVSCAAEDDKAASEASDAGNDHGDNDEFNVVDDEEAEEIVKATQGTKEEKAAKTSDKDLKDLDLSDFPGKHKSFATRSTPLLAALAPLAAFALAVSR
eukprot:gnl/TRDRNA2_/TRDRNA2_153111_c1_seq2.p1 gnl/TRDRNA2_/TRDRNA2_153111_c1~~gnl/TRDRNA2_/TRDRNA2_153111_c1_seq2.p1  ORF type:complete len:927 (-),score=199.18 gnl/TRDRNA2_/TRDRNA2_153111_c1_seq2:131-2512(-)